MRFTPEQLIDGLYGPPPKEGQKKLEDFKKKHIAKPEKPKGAGWELPPNLAEQYASQKSLLLRLGLLKELSTGELGILGLDNKEYPFPTQEQISARMTQTPEKQEFIEKKQEQGFEKLLIVPFGLKLDALIEIYKKTILDHYAGMPDPNDSNKRVPDPRQTKLFAAQNDRNDPAEPLVPLELDEKEPVWIWQEGYQNADTEGKLVYFPKDFSQNHQGKTKTELLKEDPDNAFQIILIEDLPNIPRGGQGRLKGNRPQIDTAGSSIKQYIEQKQTIPSPAEYLKALQEDPLYQGEQGLTPEDQLIYVIAHLEETDQVIDDYQGNGSVSYQIGAYFPASGRVPNAFWNRGNRQVDLGGFASGSRLEFCGVRASVRV